MSKVKSLEMAGTSYHVKEFGASKKTARKKLIMFDNCINSTAKTLTEDAVLQELCTLSPSRPKKDTTSLGLASPLRKLMILSPLRQETQNIRNQEKRLSPLKRGRIEENCDSSDQLFNDKENHTLNSLAVTCLSPKKKLKNHRKTDCKLIQVSSKSTSLATKPIISSNSNHLCQSHSSMFYF